MPEPSPSLIESTSPTAREFANSESAASLTLEDTPSTASTHAPVSAVELVRTVETVCALAYTSIAAPVRSMSWKKLATSSPVMPSGIALSVISPVIPLMFVMVAVPITGFSYLLMNSCILVESSTSVFPEPSTIATVLPMPYSMDALGSSLRVALATSMDTMSFTTALLR